MGEGNGETQQRNRPSYVWWGALILLDSSAIVAYQNEADENHTKATRILNDVAAGKYASSVITDYVFDEIVTVMLVKTRDLRKAVDTGEKLLAASRFVRVEADSFDLAWSIFKEQRKTYLSFTDCTSIAVCRANGISNIATFDEDFNRVPGLTIVDG